MAYDIYDYPDDKQLGIIREWDFRNGFGELMKYVKALWWMPDWGWTQNGNRYWISTGGWSGNEQIIGAMMKNFIFWSQCWKTSRAGGHYTFTIRRIKNASRNRRDNNHLLGGDRQRVERKEVVGGSGAGGRLPDSSGGRAEGSRTARRLRSRAGQRPSAGASHDRR